MIEKPTIVRTGVSCESRLFRIESVDLCFSNGQTRVFERIHSHKMPAVMIIPWLDDKRFLMVKEYAVGLDSYQLGFPKGLAEPGEAPEEAALRELREETGFAAQKFDHLKSIATAPGFMSSMIHVIQAEGLFESQLPGDEPEPLRVEEVHIDEIAGLLEREDFLEARSMAALLLVLIYRRKL